MKKVIMLLVLMMVEILTKVMSTISMSVSIFAVLLAAILIFTWLVLFMIMNAVLVLHHASMMMWLTMRLMMGMVNHMVFCAYFDDWHHPYAGLQSCC